MVDLFVFKNPIFRMGSHGGVKAMQVELRKENRMLQEKVRIMYTLVEVGQTRLTYQDQTMQEQVKQVRWFVVQVGEMIRCHLVWNASSLGMRFIVRSSQVRVDLIQGCQVVLFVLLWGERFVGYVVQLRWLWLNLNKR